MLPTSLTCGGVESGCVLSPQCSCRVIMGTRVGREQRGDACVPCTGHSAGTVQRGGAVPSDEITASVKSMTVPCAVAVSGSGSVLVLGFS